ncbi:hypothetical protein Y032_0026g1302 [Ancylostoma ceylanicum]|uniref:Uncharacterized protein n=1 Tax=Ancylostoma ceylanicum TaxID=53326 RepID=A0A016UU17_9BILA|nr:hypothetical protein Y032_0026g1302 [Ancylostoma ceylanicum]
MCVLHLAHPSFWSTYLSHNKRRLLNQPVEHECPKALDYILCVGVGHLACMMLFLNSSYFTKSLNTNESG